MASVAGHDDVIAHWSGHDSPPDHDERRRLIREWSDRWRAGQPCAGFVVEWDRRPVGNVEIIPSGTATGSLSWTLYAGFRGRGLASRAVRVLADWALTEAGQGGLGLGRVEAFVEPENAASLRVATRAGLRREGVRRLAPGTGDRREASEYVILARLASDPPLTDPHGLRALLNSFLPRKRVIAQLLVRDPGTECCCVSSPTSGTGISPAAWSRWVSHHRSRSAGRWPRSWDSAFLSETSS